MRALETDGSSSRRTPLRARSPRGQASTVKAVHRLCSHPKTPCVAVLARSLRRAYLSLPQQLSCHRLVFRETSQRRVSSSPRLSTLPPAAGGCRRLTSSTARGALCSRGSAAPKRARPSLSRHGLQLHARRSGGGRCGVAGRARLHLGRQRLRRRRRLGASGAAATGNATSAPLLVLLLHPQPADCGGATDPAPPAVACHSGQHGRLAVSNQPAPRSGRAAERDVDAPAPVSAALPAANGAADARAAPGSQAGHVCGAARPPPSLAGGAAGAAEPAGLRG